uniref:Uncharacterized protein n=1 Tax=Aquila chrysaetos chrysaetos TaxID=223781 RepID=A0A663DZC8_AQUCH
MAVWRAFLTCITYCAQEKYFHQLRQFAALKLKKQINGPVSLFFAIPRAILQLGKARKNHSDVSLYRLLELIYAHKRCKNIGKGCSPPRPVLLHITSPVYSTLKQCLRIQFVNLYEAQRLQ